MSTIKVKISRSRTVSAAILPELPAVGDTFKGRRVTALEPCPLDLPQPRHEVYAFAVWRLRRKGAFRPVYVAVYEADGDIF